MKIYIVIGPYMYCTASERLAKAAMETEGTKAVIEWNVKTQGKNYDTFAEGKYIMDKRNK